MHRKKRAMGNQREAGQHGGRMRVLFVIDSLEPGGAELSLASMIPHLSSVEAKVCHLYPGARLVPRVSAAGVEVASLDLPGRYVPLRAIMRLRREVRRWKPDLIHSQLWRSGMAARTVARLCSVPLVHTLVNEPLVSISRPGGDRWRARLLQRLDRASAPWVTAWVANSAAIAAAQATALALPKDRLQVIYRGRDVEVFSPALHRPVPREATRDPVMLNVGRLRLAKGQEQLLDALPAVLARVPDARLEIAGEGPCRRGLEDRCRRLGIASAVRFLGHRDDVPKLLRHADLFLFPSRHEGHPGALVEAMLSGIPIVASDLPVHRETVRDGRTGVLVPMDDPEAWARAIVSLLEQPDRSYRMGLAARRDAEQRFDVRRAARLHEQLYRAIAARDGSHSGIRR